MYGVCGYSVTGGVTLDYFVSSCLGGGSSTYLIPDEAPTGATFTTSVEELPELEGFETGLDVIMPETGKILEIGKVEEDTSDDEENTDSEETTEKENENKTEKTTNTTTETTKKNTEFNKSIFIGDSRTVGMQQSVESNSSDVWSCKGSMGYDWMVSTGVPQIESQVTNGTAIFIWMGINGLEGTDAYANKYISYIDKKAEEWAKKGATTYFVSIGPVNETIETQYGYSTKNSDIEYFNKAVKQGLKKAEFIDIYSNMKSNGFGTSDGLHYNVDTYKEVYSSMKDSAKTGTSSVENNPDDTSDNTHIITKGDYILIEFDTDNGVDGCDLDTANVQADMTLEKGDVIGITNEYNMKLILYDTKDAIIHDIEDYFVLPERNGKSNGKNSEIDLENDFEVNTECNKNVIRNVDDFRKMFPKDEFEGHIYDNAQAFIDTQEKYNVNAVFAACVTIIESSGGTNWAAIPASSYNWYSISGSHNGKSVYTNREWCAYDSFADAIDHFGELISSSSYYFQAGNNTVSEIAIPYCDAAWGEAVNEEMAKRLERLTQ